MTWVLTALLAVAASMGLLLALRVRGAVGVTGGVLLMVGGLLGAPTVVPGLTGEPWPDSAYLLLLIPLLGVGVWHATHPRRQGESNNR
ncbi:hypothetical protein SAMN05445756_0793 [Kytococcus aerolatus]|uniref:Integral membrane protein n=1 Tax=Kytococcus aerolatus TaxID=592308 RepID=A0A212TA37_9MICO|nr:hypothetical protein [Kytococcus aerolatus]SNC62908.1 hypothetical protein SAMN05445756_0793 [Kytococcus aerolatus]